MKIKETILANGGKILVLTLSPTEARLLSTELPDQPKMRWWFDTITNDTQYIVKIEVDWNEGGTIQDN